MQKAKPHFPPGFGLTPKPHIQKVCGEWWATFPDNWPAPPLELTGALGVFLRKLNGITLWRPTSWLFPASPLRQ